MVPHKKRLLLNFTAVGKEKHAAAAPEALTASAAFLDWLSCLAARVFFPLPSAAVDPLFSNLWTVLGGDGKFSQIRNHRPLNTRVYNSKNDAEMSNARI